MKPFPLHGVIGVVANDASELDSALAKNLACVEIRADLLLDAGLTLDAVMDIVRRAKKHDLGCLFTLRHPSHGGRFHGAETERVSINRQALAAGADIVDLEWDSAAAPELLAEQAPLVLSFHDFDAMPDEPALAALTGRMLSAKPRAIKVVPSAKTLADAARMLQWVGQGDGEITRIGFAMGALGACSRILTIAFGAPVTYASFGAPVAPGQVAIDDLLTVYRAAQLDRATRVIAVIGDHAGSVNRQLQAAKLNKVAIAFAPQTRDDLTALQELLRIDDIIDRKIGKRSSSL